MSRVSLSEFHPIVLAALPVTAGRRLLSFDAASGTPSEGFGTNGEVDMVVGYGGTPTIYKNVIMLGAGVNEIPLGPPGDTRAFDAITGKKLWDFHTVPRPGEIGHETWLDNGWENRSGTNIWAFSMTVDEARGIVYMPVAGPAANYWGGDRPGNNLFGNSIVAVDIATGTHKWHFQTVHHDIWDIDMSAAPGLVDITHGGRTIPALATVARVATCSSSIARMGGRCSASRSVQSQRAMSPASGIRRRSHSR